MGSRSFGSKTAKKAHLVRGRGLGGELTDLRADVDAAFSSLESEIDNTPADETKRTHAAIVTAFRAGALPGTTPAPVLLGQVVTGLSFSANDLAFRVFKIPTTYFANPALHIHWSKDGDSNQAGKNVRWQVSYLVFNGSSDDVTVAPTVITFDDTYLDSGTTSRIVYRTPSIALSGFAVADYLAVKIGVATAPAPAMTVQPVLVSLDLEMDEVL